MAAVELVVVLGVAPVSKMLIQWPLRCPVGSGPADGAAAGWMAVGEVIFPWTGFISAPKTNGEMTPANG